MSRSLTRRGLLMFGAALPALLRGMAAGAGEASKDQGIGGTGWTAGTDSDQGIGGTGIVGTIQRFGSIFVNGVRVGYAPDVPVWIDGTRVTASSLKVGHVVRVAVMVVAGRTVTRAIHVTSEVVGPVDRATAGSLSILGQQVDIARLPRRSRIRPGDVVAVFGIRRPDGKIVASLIEARPDETQYLVRGLAIAKSGALLVGRLKVGSQSSKFAGRRVEVALAKAPDGYKVLHLAAETPIPHSRAGGVLYETFLQRQGRRLKSGLGVALDDQNDAPKPAGIVRAFLDVRFDREGHVVSASRQAGSQSPDQPGVPAQRASGDVPASPATGPQGGVNAPGGADGVGTPAGPSDGVNAPDRMGDVGTPAGSPGGLGAPGQMGGSSPAGSVKP